MLGALGGAAVSPPEEPDGRPRKGRALAAGGLGCNRPAPVETGPGSGEPFCAWCHTGTASKVVETRVVCRRHPPHPAPRQRDLRSAAEVSAASGPPCSLSGPCGLKRQPARKARLGLAGRRRCPEGVQGPGSASPGPGGDSRRPLRPRLSRSSSACSPCERLPRGPGPQPEAVGDPRWRATHGSGRPVAAGDPRRWVTRGSGQPEVAGDPRCRVTRGSGRPEVAGDPRWRVTRGSGRPVAAGDPRWQVGGQRLAAGAPRGTDTCQPGARPTQGRSDLVTVLAAGASSGKKRGIKGKFPPASRTGWRRGRLAPGVPAPSVPSGPGGLAGSASEAGGRGLALLRPGSPQATALLRPGPPQATALLRPGSPQATALLRPSSPQAMDLLRRLLSSGHSSPLATALLGGSARLSYKPCSGGPASTANGPRRVGAPRPPGYSAKAQPQKVAASLPCSRGKKPFVPEAKGRAGAPAISFRETEEQAKRGVLKLSCLVEPQRPWAAGGSAAPSRPPPDSLGLERSQGSRAVPSPPRDSVPLHAALGASSWCQSPRASRFTSRGRQAGASRGVRLMPPRPTPEPPAPQLQLPDPARPAAPPGLRDNMLARKAQGGPGRSAGPAG
ncbi:collagen alpha-1(III) chain-like [Canis lupus familiaris]|uniref:collagen alpha-1(III) chain-like n=1 Tax=Canis lupus familiaris TaxID=9615 RepID=UPI0018F2C375|nr:collagen alpha-1(III) chain-like [Canis lupus familiaris]